VLHTELQRVVVGLAALMALILHNPHGAPEKIIHVREDFRFDVHDGGYSQLKPVLPPSWDCDAAAS